LRHGAVLAALGSIVLASGGGGALADESRAPYRSRLPVEGRLPPLEGAVQWLNSDPLTAESLQGKVVLVNFWTYSCINCIRTIPYERAWFAKYKDQGLVVIGVHTPEFAFEKKVENVKTAIGEFKIAYPVAVDSNFRLWRAFGNRYWPAQYLIDGKGRIRYHAFGEGGVDETERAIQDLLAEMRDQKEESALVIPDAQGIVASPDPRSESSFETYVGYSEVSNFASAESLRPDVARRYTVRDLRLNRWGLDGNWTVGAEQATLNEAGGGIAYHFSARDLHLILGSATEGAPIRFRVTIDGKAPGADHGADIDEDGYGTIGHTRLYQLVRQSGAVRDRTFEIRFLQPGAQAFTFTFG
jgi:thiol-disulfide isomerase/thioredoxin